MHWTVRHNPHPAPQLIFTQRLAAIQWWRSSLCILFLFFRIFHTCLSHSRYSGMSIWPERHAGRVISAAEPIRPFIFYPAFRVAGSWSLSQSAWIKRQTTPWTGQQSIERHRYWTHIACMECTSTMKHNQLFKVEHCKSKTRKWHAASVCPSQANYMLFQMSKTRLYCQRRRHS